MIRKFALLGAAVLAAGAVTIPAFAHDANPTDEDRAAKQAEREVAQTERKAAFADSLAEKLGVDAADVATALEELHAERQAERQSKALERLDQALADGKITQEQYDTMKARVEAGDLPRPGMRRGGPGGPGRHRGHEGQRGPHGGADDADSPDETVTPTSAA